MPVWMKLDAGKYPNIKDKNGKPVDSPSPNFNATLNADKKAFAARDEAFEECRHAAYGAHGAGRK